MGYHLRIFGLLTLALARGRMQYRLNFLAEVLGMLMAYTGQFVALRWLTLRFPAVAGWDFQGIILLYALAILAWGVAVSLFFHFHTFEDQVAQGTFDRVLVRPVHPFVAALAGSSPIAGTGQLLFAVAAIAWAAHAAGLRWTPAKLLYLAGAGLGGGLIFGGALVWCGGMAFYTRRSITFYWTLIFPGRQLIHYPANIYHPALQAFLTAVVPFAFVNFFPAHALLDRAARLPWPLLAWATPLVGAAFFYLCYRFWMSGLRRYAGAGS